MVQEEGHAAGEDRSVASSVASGPFVWSARGDGPWEAWHGELSWLDRVVPEDRAVLVALAPKVVAEGVASAEIRLREPGGAECWYLARASLAAGGGAERRWSGVLVDVDEQKRAALVAQERLRQEAALLQLSRALERVETRVEACTVAEAALRAATRFGVLWMYVFTPDLRYGDVYFANGPARDAMIQRLTIAGDQMLEEIVSGIDIVVVEDARTDPRTDKVIVAHLGNRTIINMPVMLLERHLGAVGTGTCGDEGVRPPTDAEKRFIRAMASQLAVVLDRIDAIEKRREAEARLRESEEHHRQIVDHLQAITFLFDVGADGRFRVLEGNPAFTELLRLARVAWVGKLVEELVPAAVAGDLLPRIRACAEGGAVRKEEVTADTSRGRRTFDMTLVPVRDVDGRVYRIAGISRDITEARAAERALYRLNRALRTLSRGNEALVRASSEQELVDRMCQVLVDEGGHRLAWIGLRAEPGADLRPVAWAPRVGGAPEVVLRSLPSELPWVAHDLEVGDGSAFRAAALERGFRSAAALPLRGVGDGGVLALFSADPQAFDDAEAALLTELADDLAYGVAMLRMRSERDLAEEALRSLTAELERRVAERTAELARAARAKDEFLASMSHELRTPLNGVLGTAEVIEAGVYGPVTPDTASALGRIRECGEHLLSLINDILDVAKVEAGKLELALGPVDVEALCAASLRLVEAPAHRKNIELTLETSLDLPQIQADERRLKQVLANLLTNAVKFTPEGGKVGLSAHLGERGDTLCFSVRDTGIGISQEDLARLFQPFVQLDARLSRQQTGTGLGLALVRRLTEKHRGTVEVESEPGHGSRFTVVLPLAAASLGGGAPLEARPPADVAPTSLARAQLSGMRVLVVDDVPTHLAVVRGLGRTFLGVAIDVAEGGEEAVAKAAAARFDLVLMDLHMPRMSGIEAARRIRAQGSDVPIVAMTADSAGEEARKAREEAGMRGVLLKPVRRVDLERVLLEHAPPRAVTSAARAG